MTANILNTILNLIALSTTPDGFPSAFFRNQYALIWGSFCIAEHTAIDKSALALLNPAFDTRVAFFTLVPDSCMNGATPM